MEFWAAIWNWHQLQQQPLKWYTESKLIKASKVHCSFCKKNGEDAAFYNNHKLRDENNKICCPILKAYTCPNCHVTGNHTASYCPLKRKQQVNKRVTQPSRRREARRGSMYSHSSSASSQRSALRARNWPVAGNYERRRSRQEDDRIYRQRTLEIQTLAYTLQAFIIQELPITSEFEQVALGQ